MLFRRPKPAAQFRGLDDVSDYGATCFVMTDPDRQISIRYIEQWNPGGADAGHVTERIDLLRGDKYSPNVFSRRLPDLEPRP